MTGEVNVWHCAAASRPKRIDFPIPAADALLSKHVFTHMSRSCVEYMVAVIHVVIGVAEDLVYGITGFDILQLPDDYLSGSHEILNCRGQSISPLSSCNCD